MARTRIIPGLALTLLLCGAWMWAQGPQSAGTTAPQDPKATVPDAPSTARPANPFPAGTRPAPKAQPREDESTSQDVEPQPDPPMPSPEIRTAPAGSQPAGDDSGRDAFTIRTQVNFVTVPVTVKDPDGHMVGGLLRRDFAVYEDGEPQAIQLFTSDPFPLAAAVIVDQGMSETALRRVNQTFSSISGAFSEFDEVALYTYGNTVRKVSDFRAVGDTLVQALERTKSRGRTGGVPVTSGPMASGPTVNGRPVDPSSPSVVTPRVESRVLNDAILAAALDLANQPRARRRIIFIISDGMEDGSKASYNEVMKLLLSHEISVYSIGVDSAAIPVYRRLAQMKVPGMGTGNILPKFVSATGGEHFTEFTREAIAGAYAKLTEVARNQYTLGYTTRATAASNYRSIEVRVKRPGLRVYARDGYYPLPPRPSTTQ